MFHCKYSLAHKARHSLQTNKGCCRHAYIQGSHGLQTYRQGMLQACRHLDKRRRDIQTHKDIADLQTDSSWSRKQFFWPKWSITCMHKRSTISCIL